MARGVGAQPPQSPDDEEFEMIALPLTRVAALTTALALAAVLATACAPEPADQGDAAAAAPDEPSTLRLHVLRCGYLTIEDTTPFNLTGEEAGTNEMFVPCYLIDHPDGKLLWDLGLPATARSGEYPMPGGQLSLERTVVEQLGDLDLEPEAIDFVAMSHLHWDHSGQVAEFAGAKQLMQRAEYEAAFADPVTVPGFDPSLYSALADSDFVLLEGDHDVFGDGRVVIHSRPGHTPGHQTLFIDLAETGPLVLSGDLYHFPANRELRRPPHFNVDAEQTLASMDATEAFLEESGATLWIEHDARLAETLLEWPAYYE